MLMKNFDIRPTANSTKSDPVGYLLSDFDWTGKPRSVKPEILMGDKFSLELSIAENHRKFKYTSGVLSFADSEKLTEEQINTVCLKFLDTFLPNQAQDNVPYLFVAHRDKGNLEIHYVVSMAWNLENGKTKAFNMAPPGERSLQLQNDFVATTNHELGFNQIAPNPLKAAFNQFDRLDTKESKNRTTFKQKMSSSIGSLILKGEFKNRNDLIEFLKENGTVTRVGNDYISFKLPKQNKPIRLKGEMFKDGADYSKLIKDYKQYRDGKAVGIQLTEKQYDQINTRLKNSIQARSEWNDTNFKVQPPKVRTRAQLYVVGANGKKYIPKKPNTVKAKQPIKSKSSEPETIKSNQSISDAKTPEKMPLKLNADVVAIKADKPKENSSNDFSIGGSSGSSSADALMGELVTLRTKIANEKNPLKAQILKAKANMLELRIKSMKENEERHLDRLNKISPGLGDILR